MYGFELCGVDTPLICRDIQAIENRWQALVDVAALVTTNDSTGPVHQLQIIFESKRHFDLRFIDLPALDLAVAGAGIALTSSLLAAPGLADGAVQRTGGDSISARDGYYLVIGDVGAPQAKEFAHWLKTLLVSAA